MKSAGLLFDESFHYIDHLAPFCSLLGCPLIVCEPSVAALCRAYYPELEVCEVGVRELKNCFPETVIACDNRALLRQALRGWIPEKFRMLWLPHGLSDKGWKQPFFETLQEEDGLLVYGQRMRDVLQAKQVQVPCVSVGNFRKVYFEKHRQFYTKLMDEKFGAKEFVLYAPTWEDSEGNGTFWEAIKSLRTENLLIKLHPNTERKYMLALTQCKARFLENFPPVYPVLERTNVYIGDMSSIGYDFLCYERPLFFVRKHKTDPATDPSAFLMRCGQQVLIDELPTLDWSVAQPMAAKRALYAHAFDPLSDLAEVHSWLSAH